MVAIAPEPVLTEIVTGVRYARVPGLLVESAIPATDASMVSAGLLMAEDALN